MAEGNPDNPKISRRGFLKFAGVVTGATVVNRLIENTTNPTEATQAQPDVQAPFTVQSPSVAQVPPQTFSPPEATIALKLPTPIVDISPLRPLLKEGASLRTDSDLIMLNSTQPGIDLKYAGNPEVARIRAIPDPTKRIMAAIGFLDVEKSTRYSIDTQGVYICNVYAIDLLRLLLGNDAIGSRYLTQTGKPVVAGLADVDWSSQAAIDKVNTTSPFLHSNNLDWWMKKYGTKQGWHQAKTQEELKQMLKTGAIGVGVSSQSYIENQRTKIKAKDPNMDFSGHMLVVGAVSSGDSFYISQATNNIQLLEFPGNSSEEKVNPTKVDPESGNVKYSFWVHNLPPVPQHSRE